MSAGFLIGNRALLAHYPRSHFMTNAMSTLNTNTCRGRVDIGFAVKQSREATGYSVEDLSLTSGLTGAEIIRIELGADVDPPG